MAFVSRKKIKSGLESRNSHINFEREAKKTNSRKWPTEVVCVDCGKRFILPFRPRKPEICCDDCFKKRISKRRRKNA